MKKIKSISGKVHTPQEKAEQRLAAKGFATEQWSDVDARRLIHELQVHQIELEMQNEELRRARADLEESRSKYSNLYDFAPLGYFTFDQQGTILEVNFTGSTLLGVARSDLSKKPFVSFIAPEHQDAFHLHLRQVMQTKTRQSCEIMLARKDGARFHALLESIAVDDGEQIASQCRTVVIDITGRKLAEAEAQSLARFPEENPNPVMRVTSEGSILYANRPARDMLAEMGCAAEGPIPNVLLQCMRQVIADGRSREREVTCTAGRVFSFVIAPGSGEEHINLYGRDITERKQIVDAQSFLLQCDYKGLDKDFFESLARYLAEKLHMYYVCIDQLHGDGLTAKTLAIYCDEKFEDNVEYALQDTPCGDVVGKTICTFPKDVCRLFPRDRVLQEMHAESYVGTTLWSSQGKPIGLIAVIGLQQLPNPGLVESILQLVAVRAAGELERRQAEEALRRTKDELELRVQERTAELEQTNLSLMREIQERQRVHDIVVKQSRLLESFFSSTITPLMFLDRHFNVIRVNEAYAKAFRRSAHKFSGCNYFDIYPQPDLKEIFTSVAATGEPFEAVSMPFILPDQPELGTTYWNWTLTPLLEEHDKVESLVFSLEDVTETQKSHQALKAASLYTRSLIEASLDPLVTINRDGIIMDVNRGTELAIGLPREQIIGSDFSSYFTEPEKARAGYEQVFSNGFVQDYHLAIRHCSGAVMDVLYNAAVYKNSAGEVEGVFAAARDISERKRMENALIQSEQRLMIAQQIAHLGSWEWNIMSGEELWSDEMYRIFGYDPQAIMMTHDMSFNAIHPDDKDYVTQTVREALETGTSYNIDFRIIRPDGEVRYLNSQAELYMDEQGSPLRMVGSVLDITDRKNIEIELQESGQQLRFLSAQLLTAQEMERKRIAGEVHDELGQAMTVLKLRLRTIEKQLRQDQEKVKGECLDLLGYADGILKSVRRISRDLTPSVLDDLGLSAAVRWLVDNFRQNPDLNIELHADDIDSLVPKVLQINIYRILQECLNNCVKHAEARNITVSIRNNHDGLMLCVEDDGQGFNPYQQSSLDASKKGIGISTMRERAMLLNGTIDITSREGTGTIITLQIPRKEEGEPYNG